MLKTPLIDAQNIFSEFFSLKAQFFNNKYTGQKIFGNFETNLRVVTFLDSNSQICLYYSTFLVVSSLTSVPCERGFSIVKWTKGVNKGKMTAETLNDSMMIKLNGPEELHNEDLMKRRCGKTLDFFVLNLIC